MQKPTLGRILFYRGKHGYQAMRSAIVSADTASLDPRGVDAGDVPALDSDTHVHLWVFSPGPNGGFDEYNVPFGGVDDPADLPPGTWCWPPRTPAAV